MKKLHLVCVMCLVGWMISGCSDKDLLDINDENQLKKASVAGEKQTSFEIMPNELIIKFKDDVSLSQQQEALLKINGKVKEKIHTGAMKNQGDNQGILLVSTPLQAFDAIAKAKGLGAVLYAEPNYVYHHTLVSNDSYFTSNSLWGMYGDATRPANQYGSQAGEAWAAGHVGESSVYVGVIDEGAMFSHEDLASNFWTNPFDPIDGIDNDKNGYIDDVHGWDFDGNNNSTFDGIQDDHGTHVSGTIGAVGGNGKGVAGVNWKVTIISAKFLGRNGGTTANAIKAADYITDLKTLHGLNIVATNNSWGGGGFSQALQDAIDRANTADILFVAAAGNDGLNTESNTSYPSGYPNSNIIAVASITSTGALSSFSNYAVTKVDLGAPGSAIYSTVPVKSGKGTISGYASYSGTSMATPHVTGACALYASTHPGSNAAQIKAGILNSVIATSSLNGKCVTGGRLNAGGF